MNLRLTRRRFAWTAAAAAFGARARAQPESREKSPPGQTAREAPLKAVGIVAHPDDEFTFAATAYRFARELGGTMDQVLISNGEAGYRYSLLAEQVYGLALTDEKVGRAHLPEIRKQETLAAGRILGIRHHYFLNQKDAGYTLNADDVNSVWDKKAVRAFLSKLLAQEQYSFVFTTLPSPD